MTEPRIPFVEKDEATGAVSNTYDAVEDKFGMVLNLVKCLGNSEACLNGTMNLMGAMEQFDVDPKYSELVYLKTSQVNECNY